MDWDDVSYVLRSKTRKAVLASLEHPKTPTSIARELGISTPNVSRALRELTARRLIVSLTPAARSGKLLQATQQGRLISAQLKVLARQEAGNSG
jgi:DNA-binding MarR family transcriptional regulator